MDKIPFALYDDHALRGHAFKRLLLQLRPLRFIFKTHSKPALLKSVHMLKDILFVCYPFANKSSEDVIKLIKEKAEHVKIIVFLQVSVDPGVVLKLINDGAKAILPVDANAADVLDSVSTLLRQEYYFNDCFSSAMLSDLRKRGAIKKGSMINFNEKEIKILKYLYQENSHEEIAPKVDLKTKSVDNYVTEMIHRVEGRTVIGLIKYGLRHKLIPHEDLETA